MHHHMGWEQVSGGGNGQGAWTCKLGVRQDMNGACQRKNVERLGK